MTERIDVSDGTHMLLHVEQPAGRVNGGAIMVFQEAFGVNDYIRAVARRFADLGLLAVAPEFYHRSGDGSTAAYDAGMSGVTAFSKALTPAHIEADVRSTHAWLGRQPGIDVKRIAAIGFCQGGRVAYMANAFVELAAAASFYGGNMWNFLDLAARQHAPIVMFWGDRDASISRADRERVHDALNAADARHTQVVFSRAGHGFFRHVSEEAYDPAASAQAWALVTELLRETGVLPAP
jgi:carboxymethylenebutenolidase